MAVAGCTSQSPGSAGPGASGVPAATTPPAEASATTPPAEATAVSGGGTSSFASAFDFSKVRWYEYELNVSPAGVMNGTVRMDLGVDYNGTKANKMTSTLSMNLSGSMMDTITVIYSDPASGKALGGHTQDKLNGQITSDEPIRLGEYASPNDTSPLGAFYGSTMAYEGAETIKVPAGTYPATKYALSDGAGNNATLWAATGVPIPVKITCEGPASIISEELAGWQ